MRPFSSLAEVPDDRLTDAFLFCHQSISEARGEGKSLFEVATEIGVGLSALKQIVKKGQEPDLSKLRRGAAFAKVFDYFSNREKQKDRLGDFDLNRFFQQLQDQTDETQKLSAYATLNAMLRIVPEAQRRASARAFKRLYCFRNAVNDNYLVKSEVKFRCLNKGSSSIAPIFEFEHNYMDNNGSKKRSDGIAMAINKTIYLIGDIQNGEGLDIMLIREPVDESHFMIGFHISNDDYHPLFANMVCFDAKRYDDLLSDPGDNGKDKTGLLLKSNLEKNGLLGNSDLGEDLVRQLKSGTLDRALRIEQRFLRLNLFKDSHILES